MNQYPHWLLALRAGVLTTFAALLTVLRNRLFQVVAIGLMFVVFPFAWFLGTMPDISIVEQYKPWQSVQIFDRKDRLVATVSGDEDRIYVPLSRISPNMKHALISAEDRRFYEHKGADISSMFRAALTNFHAHRIVEGGSTISQQLVKNLFFKPGDRSLERKARELVLAIQLERRYPKERILEMYLNQVYFGRGAYGIERASQQFFGKSADKLTVNEAAFLAGMVKAPSMLSLKENLADAIKRKNEILVRMTEDGFITKKDLTKLEKQPLVFKQRLNQFSRYPYYVSYVLDQLEQELKIDVHNASGLKVYTNLDPTVQQAAEKTLTAGIKKAPKGINQGALVTMDVKTGGVLAMVGGVGPFLKHQWNRAVSGHTAGSSFKPFVYLAAFESGAISPDDQVSDDPIVIPQRHGAPYAPKNFDSKYYGPIPVLKALAMSRNTCAVRVAQLAGISRIVDVARRAGISTRIDPYISLALGSAAVTPLEMSGAYGCFARKGVYIKPQVIRRIENSDGQLIKDFRVRLEKRFKTSAIAQLVRCLKAVVQEGTGARAQMPGVPVIGKTGTADGATDVWFVGATPNEVTAVWGGTDKPIHKHNNYITGGNLMAVIWKDHTTAYMAARKKQHEDTKLNNAAFTFDPKELKADLPTDKSRSKNSLISKSKHEDGVTVNLKKLFKADANQNDDSDKTNQTRRSQRHKTADRAKVAAPLAPIESPEKATPGQEAWTDEPEPAPVNPRGTGEARKPRNTDDGFEPLRGNAPAMPMHHEPESGNMSEPEDPEDYR